MFLGLKKVDNCDRLNWKVRYCKVGKFFGVEFEFNFVKEYLLVIE